MREKKVSIKDIAKQLGTSTTTVSFVINGKGREKKISDELIEKVEELVAKLNYQPNALAKSFRTGKTKTIGFIVDEISQPFFSGIARFIDEIASEYGYNILFSSTKNNKKRGSEILEVFSGRCVDGFIIALPGGLEEEVQRIIASGIPVVLFDRYLPAIDSDYVLIDNENSVKQAVDHLQANGYKHIAFVTIETDEKQMVDREIGYENAVRTHGLETCVKRINYQNKKQSVDEIKSFLLKNNELDAVIFSCNYLSVDGLDALVAAELKIGEDMAVVSFDDLDMLRYLKPSITAISQPLEEIATKIIETLLYRMSDNSSKDKIFITLDAKLEIRDSSKPVNQNIFNS
ncbi:LacI family DNA-binding transcriptional regulator [Pedobacter endophyticus]|uniref:LacI family DNA-binding transcriptional regulator n=1 Tax=Pedobacter endophyticus TaxID=2789740 RepID=A0A7S9Q0M0_9SPHI|nr:LacI family DNA-binding transcriptional regulator [Pedobacter endophyticus]QPH40837.1 LacI family DNA-binding transcriptional regulator [Pedobacter endophyticus]